MKYDILDNTQIDTLMQGTREIGREVLEKREEADIQRKADKSLVTSSDLHADSRLKELLPSVVDLPVFSEETITGGISNDCWLIDPIDGTNAYVAGIATWGISIALITAGEVRFGLIYFPVSGTFLHSQMDSSVFSIRGEIANPGSENFILLPSDHHRSLHVDFPGKIRALGACISNIYFTVTGRADFAVLGYCNLWDFATAVPFAERSGAQLYYLDGSNFETSPFICDPARRYKPLILSAPQVKKNVLEWIRERQPGT